MSRELGVLFSPLLFTARCLRNVIKKGEISDVSLARSVKRKKKRVLVLTQKEVATPLDKVFDYFFLPRCEGKREETPQSVHLEAIIKALNTSSKKPPKKKNVEESAVIKYCHNRRHAPAHNKVTLFSWSSFEKTNIFFCLC